MIKLFLVFLFCYTIKKGIDYKHEFKTERRMEKEKDDRVEEHHKLPNGGCIAQFEKDVGVDKDDDTSKINRMLSDLGAFFWQQPKNKESFQKIKRLN